ncbi:MAG: AGE family epimerase/isomerase [Prolixibacteraceae bacterium]|jgi:mannobiose 2-epimerase|nr:AGE family epimerase/isomerase [Prolixibacteraceae bacterium]
MIRAFSELVNVQEKELENIMNYWIKNAVDEEKGGFVGSIDGRGLVKKDAPKGAILNGRILWSFSAAYNYSKNEKYLEMAHRAFEYLDKFFIDKKNGGVYWELDADGNPINTRKQAYAQGFAIYGLSEYYRACENERSLTLAQEIFWTIEKHYYDKEFGGYIEALSENWQAMDDMRLSAKEANEPKSMNTHLHILEPYTNLYRCWKNPILKKSIQKIIRVFLDHIVDTKTAHFNLLFSYDWTVKSSAISYGHDIEGSWLMAEAAEEIEDEALIKEVNEMAVRMVDATLEQGTDTDGSIFNEKEGTHLDTDKHWWPQAEAMVGYVNAWQITDDKKYLDEAEKVWNFIDLHIADRENGEWFWRVDAEGSPYMNEEKVGFWKCPYHNSRALIEVCTRLLK